MTSQRKVLLITNIPTPYRIPLFNELDTQLSAKGLSLKVIFGAMGYERRKWLVDMSKCAFDYDVLLSKEIPYADVEKVSFTYTGLGNIIRRWKPSIIITNAFSMATMKLWLRSLYSETPYLIWSGAVSLKGRHDTFPRRLQRRILVARAAGFVAYGTRAKEYLMSLGADPNRIKIGINTVDTTFYMNEVRTLRAKLGRVDGRKHLLYIGHLTQGKKIDNLFKSVKRLLKQRQDFVLQLVGDGPERERLQSMRDQLGIRDYVNFEGFKNKEEITQYLATADSFLFPSEYDVWGLVLVEAMAASVPCLSSIHAGATYDLIINGVTGFAMDFSDSERVAAKINWLLNNPENGREIGETACHFVSENINIKKSAEGFVSSILMVLG